MKFFQDNNLFTNKQFGFIKGRSTVLQLLTLLDNWTKYLESGGQIDIIITDFEKAFDKVPHRRLISKLKAYGVDSKLVDWKEGFLRNRQQQVKINGKHSSWKSVLSGIPQGSVLGPLLFIIFINDLPDLYGDASIYLFADDAKMFKYITKPEDSADLQNCCNYLQKWTDRWLMKLNIDKCKVLSIGREGNVVKYSYGLNTVSGFKELEQVSSIKDLGIIVDNHLTFAEHIHAKINKAYSMLGIIKRTFNNMTAHTFNMLYKGLVRSQLEYGNSVWSPYRKKLIEELERVQMRATKIIRGCKGKSYSERLEYLQLPTLKFRRLRGDMIEVYKNLTHKYDSKVMLDLPLSSNTKTRGNSLKLSTARAHYDLRKHFFSSRIVKQWNSLPDDVISAGSTNSFKKRLDRHWERSDLYYDWEAIEPGGTY
jgi:hypothetical protein